MTITSYSIILLVISALLLLHGFYSRLKWLRMVSSNMNVISDLGYVFAISGDIRSGKTTLSYGLIHFFTLKIKNELLQKMEEIKIVLKEIDFIELDDFFLVSLSKHKDFEKTFLIVINKFLNKSDIGEVKLQYLLGNQYFNFLSYFDKTELLRRYCYMLMHYVRSDHVYSASKVFNHITSSTSIEFNSDWIRLKETEVFPLDQHSIFFEDEKLLHNSNIGHQKKLAEDSGNDVFFRLFGQLFKETSYYITTLQEANRWLKLEREIAQTHIYVQKSYPVGIFPKVQFFLDLLEFFNNFFYWFAKKIKRNPEYRNQLNWFKKVRYFIFNVKKYLFSKSFIRFDCGIYHDIERVGKEIDIDSRKAYNYSFVVPVPYCYGSGATHEFFVLKEYLDKKTKKHRRDLEESKIREQEIIDLLQKYNEKAPGSMPVNEILDNIFD